MPPTEHTHESNPQPATETSAPTGPAAEAPPPARVLGSTAVRPAPVKVAIPAPPPRSAKPPAPASRRPSPTFAARPLVALPAPDPTVAPLIVAGRVLGSVAEGTAFPFLLLLIVLLFLLVQHQIDKRDPKLALAPVYRDRDLRFIPPIPGAFE